MQQYEWEEQGLISSREACFEWRVEHKEERQGLQCEWMVEKKVEQVERRFERMEGNREGRWEFQFGMVLLQPEGEILFELDYRSCSSLQRTECAQRLKAEP